MAELRLFLLGLTLAESLVLLFALWLGFRLLRGSPRIRNWCFLVLSYPGLFSMGRGNVAFIVSLPLLLGGPIWLLTRWVDPSSGVGWIAWQPAPSFAAAADAGADWLHLEIAMLIVWLLVALFVFWLLPGRPDGPPLRARGVFGRRRPGPTRAARARRSR